MRTRIDIGVNIDTDVDRDIGVAIDTDFLGGRNGNPLQYSCLENPMDRGPWWAMVHMVAKSQTRLQRLSTHSADPTESEFSTLFSSFILKIKSLLPASTILRATL